MAARRHCAIWRQCKVDARVAPAARACNRAKALGYFAQVMACKKSTGRSADVRRAQRHKFIPGESVKTWSVHMNRRLKTLLCHGAFLVAAFAGDARAQSDYPSRPIKLVVPFPAGGGIDMTARIAATALGNV